MRRDKFEPLLKHVEAREDEAARVFAEKIRALGEHERRLAELCRYADEYGRLDGERSSAALLLNRQLFRERVETALGQQRQTVERSRGSCDVERARLLLASRDAKAMERLAASHRLRLDRAEVKRGQAELDDLAVRGHAAAPNTAIDRT